MSLLPTIKSAHLRDADLLDRELSDWQIDSTQLGQGEFQLNTDRIVYSDLVIERSRQNLTKKDIYTIPYGTTSFSLFRPGSQPGHWCGFEVPENTILINRCGSENFAVLPAGYEHITISLDNALLSTWGLLSAGFSKDAAISSRSIVPLSDRHGTRVRNWLFSIFRDNQMSLLASDSHASGEFRDRLRAGLTFLLDEGLELRGADVKRYQPNQRFPLVSRACRIVQDRMGAATTTETLATDLNVNARTLQRSFSDVLGMSPNRYIQISRLRAARSILRDSTRLETTVSQVAIRHGFTELGRFSTRYREMFGELPSETLKNGTKTI